MEFRYFLTLGAAGGSCLYPKALPNAQALCSAELSRGLPFSDYLCTSSASRYLRVSVSLFLGPSRSFSISLSSPSNTPSYCAPSPPSPPLSRPRWSSPPPAPPTNLSHPPRAPGPGCWAPARPGSPPLPALDPPPLRVFLPSAPSPPRPSAPSPFPPPPPSPSPLPPPLLPLCPLRFLLPLPSGPPSSQAGEGRCPRSASPAGPDLASWVTRWSGLWGYPWSLGRGGAGGRGVGHPARGRGGPGDPGPQPPSAHPERRLLCDLGQVPRRLWAWPLPSPTPTPTPKRDPPPTGNRNLLGACSVPDSVVAALDSGQHPSLPLVEPTAGREDRQQINP